MFHYISLHYNAILFTLMFIFCNLFSFVTFHYVIFFMLLLILLFCNLVIFCFSWFYYILLHYIFIYLIYFTALIHLMIWTLFCRCVQDQESKIMFSSGKTHLVFFILRIWDGMGCFWKYILLCFECNSNWPIL